ncbi:sugar transferase [Streptomyces sp. KR80]|uniref:sugar transferase n=1 Tax=Streptomyces sp. KR80 TaxID=3457426 RepID=UPI003FD2CEE0
MTTENAGVPNPGRVVSLLDDTSRPATPAFAPLRAYRRSTPVSGTGAVPGGRAAAALAAVDCLAATAAAALLGDAQRFVVALGPAFAAGLLVGAHRGLYRPGPSTTALDELPRLVAQCVIAWSLAAALLAGLRSSAAPSWALLLGVVSAHVVLACAFRGAVHGVRRRGRRRRPQSALVVGGGPAGRRVFTALHDHPEYGMRPVGLVGPASALAPAPAPASVPADRAAPETVVESVDDTGGPGRDELDRELGRKLEKGRDPGQPLPAELPVPVLASPEDITRAVIQNAVRDAVFTRSPWEDPQDAALVRLFAELGCALWLVHGDPAADAGPRRPGGPDHIWGFACQRLDAPPRHRIGIVGKRALDIVISVVALIIAAPVMLVCAVAVRWADGPGVIFRQERIGMAGRPFTVLKFRTLRPADEHESATLWNVADDGRMSGVGHLLRRTSLDELPQLWNVLRGDMSLVGPRPERPYFVRKFSHADPGYAARHRMPAGITGLAQVHGLRGDTSIEDRARFDNHYIETWSLWQDVRILLRTAGSLFRCGGS